MWEFSYCEGMQSSVNPLLPATYDIVWSVVTALMLVLLIVALVSLARTAKRLPSAHALVWTLIAIFVPIVGPLAWLFVGRRSAAASARPLTTERMPS